MWPSTCRHAGSIASPGADLTRSLVAPAQVSITPRISGIRLLSSDSMIMAPLVPDRLAPVATVVTVTLHPALTVSETH